MSAMPPESPICRVVAHRGASEDAPENTLASFRLAWEQGADAIEGDFRLTRDGHIVCIHDADTARVADGICCAVETSTLAELRALDAGRWKGERWRGERIPTLAEVLDILPPDKSLFLEVKSGPNAIPFIEAELRARTAPLEQIVLISFNPAVIEASKKRMPMVTANLLVGFQREEPMDRRCPSVDKVVAMASGAGADGVGVANHPMVDDIFVGRLHRSGLACHIWTVNDAQEARCYIRFGVRSITTDRPAGLRAELEGRTPIA